jgi:hypothetical protein
VNVVTAAAKKYRIEPIASLDVPRMKDFGDQTYRQFKADIDHLFTQLLLDNSSRTKRDSVLISPDLKTRIRAYAFRLRELIERAEDLDDAKRQVLLHRLSEFEAALDKKRLNLLTVAMLALAFANAPGELAASGQVVHGLGHRI